MALRLRGATSGYIELKAPASAGDNTLTLPTNNGSANQLLKTDGNGNLSWTNDSTTDPTKLPLSGGTLSGHLTVNGEVITSDDININADNKKLNIGTGADLQLYHDSSSDYSYIEHTHATGHFVIRNTGADSNIYLQARLGEQSIVCHDDGAVELYNNGNLSATTASDDFDIYRRIRLFAARDMTGHQLSIGQWDGSNHRIEGGANRPIFITAYNSNGVIFGYQSGEKARVDNVGLKIATTTNSGISGSADDLIIGSIGDSTDRGITLATTGLGSIRWADAGDNAMGRIQYSNALDFMSFHTSNAERIRIDANGDIGIGTSSPTKPSSSNNTTRFMEIASGDGADLILGNNVSTNIGAGAHIGTLAFKNIDDTDGGAVPHYAGIRCESANTSGSMDLRFYIGRNNLESDAPNMIIDSAGEVGIGTASPSSKLHIIDGAGTTIKLGNTTNASTANIAYNWGGSFGLKCDPDDNAGGTKHIYMQVTGTTYFNLSSSGKVTCTGVNSLTTTGGSAVYVESDGDLLRYTSSRKYKTDIETAEDKYADEILTCRPVWYRSTSTNDIKDSSKTKSDFGWFGFIAEEIAEINPRLVNYKTKESQQQSDGTLKSVELDPSEYEAESVRYTDFIPLMVNLLKRQAAKIETLETKVAALESA